MQEACWKSLIFLLKYVKNGRWASLLCWYESCMCLYVSTTAGNSKQVSRKSKLTSPNKLTFILRLIFWRFVGGKSPREVWTEFCDHLRSHMYRLRNISRIFQSSSACMKVVIKWLKYSSVSKSVSGCQEFSVWYRISAHLFTTFYVKHSYLFLNEMY